MKLSQPFALGLLALACATLSTASTAQKVYRCGSVYSQTPCEGAVVVDVNDSRTTLQKRESDQAAARDAKAANALETRRLQEEKQVAAKDAAARKEAEQRKLAEKRAAAEAEKPKPHAAKKTKKNQKELEFFTANPDNKATDKKSDKKADLKADKASIQASSKP